MKPVEIIPWMLLLGVILFATKPLETKTKGNKKALLSLSVLPMIDKTNSKNYKYLMDSIASCVRKEIKNKFKYKPYKSSSAKKALLIILKKEKKRWSQLDEAHIKKLSSTKNIDILIYGSYTKGKSKGKTDAIVIQIGVFIQFEKKTHWVQDLKTAIGASMFTNLEKVSEAVVNKIYELTSNDRAKRTKKDKKYKNKETSTIQSLTRASLNMAKDTHSSRFLKFGVRGGFFHADSAISIGYLIDIYYTQSISLLNPKWDFAYLPDLHAFIFLEEDTTDSLNIFRLGMNLGFLYTIPTFTNQAVKLGATFGSNYELISGEDIIKSFIEFVPTTYVLVGYEYNIHKFQFSLYSRMMLISDKTRVLLGIGLALSVGYVINFY